MQVRSTSSVSLVHIRAFPDPLVILPPWSVDVLSSIQKEAAEIEHEGALAAMYIEQRAYRSAAQALERVLKKNRLINDYIDGYIPFDLSGRPRLHPFGPRAFIRGEIALYNEMRRAEERREKQRYPAGGTYPTRIAELKSLGIERYLQSLGIKLHGTGRQRYCRCPLHDDRTPSMSVDTERNLWYCHAGCGSGDIVDLDARIRAR